MREFNKNIHAGNKNHFRQIYADRVLCYIRRDIYEHILRENEDSYFALDTFFRNYKITDIKSKNQMVKTIMKELHDLGWKTKTSFGSTGLFIYSSDNPPSNCFEDGF